MTKTAALEFGSKPEQQPQTPTKTPTPVQVHEYNNPDSRLAAVAADYSARPEKSIIVAPNRAERDEQTQLARAELFSQGNLGREAYAVSVLVEKTGESKFRVESYTPGDKIHGTVTRIGKDRSMSVKLDSAKFAELVPEKTRRIGYGYAR